VEKGRGLRIYKHKGYARLQDLTARLTTRTNDNHAVPDPDLYYFILVRSLFYNFVSQTPRFALSE